MIYLLSPPISPNPGKGLFFTQMYFEGMCLLVLFAASRGVRLESQSESRNLGLFSFFFSVLFHITVGSCSFQGLSCADGGGGFSLKCHSVSTVVSAATVEDRVLSGLVLVLFEGLFIIYVTVFLPPAGVC